jgi:Protein of unknown function (DUF3455)
MTASGIFGVALLLLVPALACGQQSAPAGEVPPQLKPPEGSKLVLEVHAKGDQVYTCKQDGGQYAWTLKAPDAQLFDKSGKALGRHFGGPTWQLNDGSAVVGKLAARSDSPDKESVPWLLLTAADHSGNGLLSNVTHIQRLNTRGGKAPAAGCDASHVGAETRVAYTAAYFFYST